METQTFEQAIEKVVNFWTEKSFNTVCNQNNGDDSAAGGLVFMLQNILSSEAQQTVTPEKIEKFKEKLTELIKKQGREYIVLSVDYHPCNTLFEAAQYADISIQCFPCKTTTWIENNIAKASYQYRGKLQTL